MSVNGKKLLDTGIKIWRGPFLRRNSINWDALEKLVTARDLRFELYELRDAYEDATDKVEEFYKEPEPIDWDYWKKQIRSPVVDQMKEDFEELCRNYKDPGIADMLNASRKRFNDTLDESIRRIKKIALEYERAIAEYEDNVKRINDLKEKIMTMSVNEYCEMFPKAREEIAEEIRNDKWLDDD